MTVDGSSNECGIGFSYLASLIASSDRIDVEVDRQVACSSKVFGVLCMSMF